MKYLVVVEKSGNEFGAYVPDLPGCVAVADTRKEVVTLIQEAIEFHIEGSQGIRRSRATADLSKRAG